MQGLSRHWCAPRSKDCKGRPAQPPAAQPGMHSRGHQVEQQEDLQLQSGTWIPEMSKCCSVPSCAKLFGISSLPYFQLRVPQSILSW